MHITQTITMNGRTAICVCSQNSVGGEWDLSIISLAVGLHKASDWKSPKKYQSSEAAMDAGKAWVDAHF
jgi:hypothetical protein